MLWSTLVASALPLMTSAFAFAPSMLNPGGRSPAKSPLVLGGDASRVAAPLASACTVSWVKRPASAAAGRAGVPGLTPAPAGLAAAAVGGAAGFVGSAAAPGAPA